jgi:hypothetical protein
MDATASSTTGAGEGSRTNYWAVLSALLAAVVLPLWAFFAVSTVTWNDPLRSQASFNPMSEQAIALVQANSLELGIVIALVGLVAPFALLAIALVFGSTERESLGHGWVRVALFACGALLVLVLTTLLPLFGVWGA